MRAAAVGETPRVGGQLDRLRFRRTEAGAALDRIVPVRRPDAVAVAAPWGPTQHGGVPGNAERFTQLRQHELGICEHVVGVDDRRRSAEPVGLAVEELRLPLEPEILEAGSL